MMSHGATCSHMVTNSKALCSKYGLTNTAWLAASKKGGAEHSDWGKSERPANMKEHRTREPTKQS